MLRKAMLPEKRKYSDFNKQETLKAACLDENNKIVNVLELDPANIDSPPCRGGCGESFLQCNFYKHNCADWICTNFKICNAGITRVMNGAEPPKCYICQHDLTPRNKSDVDLESLV